MRSVWRICRVVLLLAVACKAMAGQADTAAVKMPSCIDCAADTLIFNGADWSLFFDSLRQLADTAGGFLYGPFARFAASPLGRCRARADGAVAFVPYQ